MPSHLEAGFVNCWRMIARGAPDFVREHAFAAPERKWRFDFAWPSAKVAVEIEGGVYRRGRGAHTAIGKFLGDVEKYNAAVIRGWAVLRYTEKDLTTRPVQVIQEVVSLVQSRSTTATIASPPDCA